MSIPNALEVLQTKKGDCNEHTVLFQRRRQSGVNSRKDRGRRGLSARRLLLSRLVRSLDRRVDIRRFGTESVSRRCHSHQVSRRREIDRQMDILQLIGNLKTLDHRGFLNMIKLVNPRQTLRPARGRGFVEPGSSARGEIFGFLGPNGARQNNHHSGHNGNPQAHIRPGFPWAATTWNGNRNKPKRSPVSSRTVLSSIASR